MSTRGFADIPREVLEAVQRVWFAGLGAMVLAQEEGGKLVEGTGKLFATLVEKGEEMQKEGAVPAPRVKEAVGTAGSAWGKVQGVLDTQVTAALHRLGVPTKGEIADLASRIDQLTASIEALRAQG